MSGVPSILVTGGTGFLGRHVLAEAVQRGWQTTSLSLSGSMPEHVTGISADLGDARSIKEALDGRWFDYVVNCGGYVDHRPLSKGGRALIGQHFLGLLNLVEGLDKSQLKRLINIGSSDEYGDVPAPQAEHMRERPISPYSLGKTAATHFLQMLHRSEGFPGVTLRLFLTYGPGQSAQRFLPSIIQACLRGEKFPTSFGTQLRDFCFIDDTVDAVFRALKSEAADGEVINLGSGKPVSIRAVVEQVRDIIGKGEPDFGAFPFRPSENMALFADTTKARALLDWRARTGLHDGLSKTIHWMEANT